MSAPDEELSLPEDLDAERALLSTICAQGAEHAAAECVAVLHPKDFMHPAHRSLLQALRDVLERQGEVTPLSLKEALEQNGELGGLGGYPKLIDILSGEEVGRPMVLVHRLQELRKRREFMQTAGRVMRGANNATIPLSDLESDLRSVLEDLVPAAGKPLVVLDPAEWPEEPPPLRYLVEGLLPEGAPAILAGRSNSGKSMLGMEFSFAVATGRDLFGRKGPSEPMFAVFVELEDAPDEVHRRYLRCLDLFREDPTWNDEDEANLRNNWRALVPNWASRAPRMLPALVPYLQEHARALCANGGRVGLIVLDPLASLSTGEENKAETHQVFWSACYTLAESTGSTPLVVHHVRKLSTTQGKGPSMSERLSFDSLRGSTAIVAAARAVLQVEPLTPEEAARVGLDEERAGAGNYVVLAMTKNASGPKGTWMALEQKESGETGAGFFVSLPGGDRVCAALRSKAAAAKLSLAEAVLLSIADGIEDRKELAKRHWPAESEEKGIERVKNMISDLRRKHGWLQKGRGLDLTVNGFTRVQQLKKVETHPASTLETEESEESPDSIECMKGGRSTFASTRTDGTGVAPHHQRGGHPSGPAAKGGKVETPYRGNPSTFPPFEEGA